MSEQQDPIENPEDVCVMWTIGEKVSNDARITKLEEDVKNLTETISLMLGNK